MLMGRFIDEILQPGETVRYSTNAHWMFYLRSIWAAIVALLLFAGSQAVATDWLVKALLAAATVVALAAAYWACKAWFHRFTTETDVTDRRVVHKTGFVKRHTFEIPLDKIESVDVDQSILGRILNYGDVTIMGVGEGRQKIATIASPLKFRSAITGR